MADASTPVDGRAARRERNRTAVVEAHLDLLIETGRPPAPDAVAARAGVSVSSLFRYFETLDDLQQRAIDLYFERFGARFAIAAIGEGTAEERLHRFVDARIRLHDEVAPVARHARAQVTHSEPVSARLAEVRATFAEQVRRHFAPELATGPRTEAERRADAIDTLTSFEAFDLLLTGHGRSTREIRQTWMVALRAVLSADAAAPPG